MTRPRKPAAPKGIQSLRDFRDSLESASFTTHAAVAAAQVTHEDAFDEMRAHLVRLYEDVDAIHSFVDETGAVFDCIPVEQQPALRGSSERVAKAPDLPIIGGGMEATDEDDPRIAALASPASGVQRKDWYGNAMQGPDGTIPMRRITLTDLARFPSLKAFMRKGPGGAGRPPRAVEPPTVPATHRWAHAYQNVTNGGGHSYLNLWRPGIGANQVFSLSQHWYVGGSGGGLQTVECGWQVYPQLYGNAQPHLFTYWTADDYASTGCYNLSCHAFVQTSSSFSPGMALGPISVPGGAQYQIELAYWHSGGRWWLYFNGTQGSNAIGYYPDTLFGNGALKTSAAEIDYGGETVGTTSFPAMGSGAFANQGWQHAAYQSQIGYWPPQGGALINANLSPSQGWPAWYTAQVNQYAAPWSETLWFGGPGGS